MIDPQHFRKLERVYASAPINRIFRPTLHIDRGEATVTLDARPELHHAARAVHGSVYFKALDDAAFFAVNSVVPDVFVLTASFHVDLLRPVSDGAVVARGRLVHESRRLYVAESTLTDERGRLLARGSGTFMRSSIALTPEIGYV